MRVDHYQKGLCGRLIGYYRLQLYNKAKNNQYRQRQIISYKSALIQKSCALCDKKCKERQAICSSRTINDIEAGLPVKNDCYYVDLADKVGHRFPESRKLMHGLPQYQKEFLHVLDHPDMTSLHALHQRLAHTNSHLVNVLYYDEMFQVMLMILDILIDGHYPDQEFIDMLTFLEPYLDKADQQLALFLLYRYHEDDSLDKEKAKGYLRRLKPVNLLFKLTIQSKKMTAYSMVIALANMQKGQVFLQPNWIDWFKITSYIELKQWKKALSCIEQCFDQRLTPVCVYTLYGKMGTIAYACEDYETAAFFYKHVLKYMPDVLGFNLIFLVDSILKTHPEEMDRLISLADTETMERPLTQKIMTYYRYKYQKHATYTALEEYIIHELKPLFTSQNRYYQLIQNDLVAYCTHTRDYQCLFEFLLVIP